MRSPTSLSALSTVSRSANSGPALGSGRTLPPSASRVQTLPAGPTGSRAYQHGEKLVKAHKTVEVNSRLLAIHAVFGFDLFSLFCGSLSRTDSFPRRQTEIKDRDFKRGDDFVKHCVIVERNESRQCRCLSLFLVLSEGRLEEFANRSGSTLNGWNATFLYVLSSVLTV